MPVPEGFDAAADAHLAPDADVRDGSHAGDADASGVESDGGAGDADVGPGENAPPEAAFEATPLTGKAPLTVSFDASASADSDGAIASYAWDFGDGDTASGVTATYTYLEPGTYTVTLTVADDRGATDTATETIRVREPSPYPPDPSEVAPPIDPTVPTTVFGAMAFLFQGPDPIQTNVAADAIDPERAAVLRGRLLARDGSPLPGATVRDLRHPQFGQTLSRADGRYDLMVNGGGPITLDFSLAGHLTAQRTVMAHWNDFTHVEDVILVPLDPKATVVDLSSAAEPFLVAQGSAVTDEAGTRTATLLLPRGTAAEAVLPDGTTVPLTRMTLRATEFTVGENGPKAMPGELPPSTGYTYAVELTADEALAQGAAEVRFDRPQYLYVEDFLGFKVGGIVPAGWFDRTRGVWVASKNGRVLEIVGFDGLEATLDTDGDQDSDADDETRLAAWGVTSDERRTLAQLFPVPPKRLWRVPITHMTPWDCNWPYGPPAGATSPDMPPPRQQGGVPDGSPCPEPGHSVVECQDQVLRESVPIAGTGLSLHYRSDRMPGHSVANVLDVSLTGDTISTGMKRVDVRLEIGGKKLLASYAPAVNLTHRFDWDGLDAEGRALAGWQKGTAAVGYAYPTVYYESEEDFEGAFGGIRPPSSGVASVTPRPVSEVIFWQIWDVSLRGALRTPDSGLGGWSIDPIHSYEPSAAVLYQGDGRARAASACPSAPLTHVAGTDNRSCPSYQRPCGVWRPASQAQFARINAVAVAPEGTLFVGQSARIVAIGADGILRPASGGSAEAYCYPPDPCGDGGPFSEAKFHGVSDLEIGPDGSLYVLDRIRVRRVRPDGIIEPFAGNGVYDGSSGDGGPAIAAQLEEPSRLAVGTDGSVYISEPYCVRRVGPDGVINTFVGKCGSPGTSGGDDGPAREATLGNVRALARGPDGSIYIGESRRVRRVTPDGTIRAFAGTGAAGDGGDGGPATAASLSPVVDVGVLSDGTVVVTSAYRVRVIPPTGIIHTLAGAGPDCAGGTTCGVDGPAFSARFNLIDGGAVGPRTIYVAASSILYEVKILADLRVAVLPSEDGGAVHLFDAAARHTGDVDRRTGAPVWTFERDANQRVTALVDGGGNRTTIERDAAGRPTAIVGPYGARTALSTNADGLLASVTSPAGARSTMTYGPGGLLTLFTDRKGAEHTFAYDDLGRLVSDRGPSGSLQLERVLIPDGVEVHTRTPSGLVTVDRAVSTTDGVNTTTTRTRVFPDGTQSTLSVDPNGVLQLATSDGMVGQFQHGPDPRFGMSSPLVAEASLTTPGGLAMQATQSRTARLPPDGDELRPKETESVQVVNGKTFRSQWQSASRTVTRTLPSGRKWFTLYDVAGRPLEYRAPGIAPLVLARDARGRIETATRGEGAAARTWTLTYAADGGLATLTDPLGRLTQWERDADGRVVRYRPPGFSDVTLTWDAMDMLTSLVLPSGAAHAFAFDAGRRIASYDPPDAPGAEGVVAFSHDADGRPLSVVYPDGRRIDVAYDAGGRAATLTLGRGPIAAKYADATGQLAQVSAPGQTVAFAYDGSLVTGITWSGAIAGSVSHGYDAFFRVASQEVNGGQTVAYTYDDDGSLLTAGALSVTRDAASGLVSETTLGNVTEAWTSDPFGDLAAHRYSYAAEARWEHAYTRDALRRVTRVDESSSSGNAIWEYQYDGAGRLLHVNRDGARWASYTWDANGNRLSATDAAGATTSGVYDAQDRLVSWGTATYAWRADGTLRSRTAGSAVTSCDYDELGNLMGVTLPDGRQLTYVVDGRNRRVGKRVNGELVQGFLYSDRLRPVAELDGTGAVVSRFVWGTRPNVPEYLVKGGSIFRIVADHVGSPVLVVDVATGQVAQQISYDPFGKVLSDSNPGFQPFGFAGGLRDLDTGLLRFGARDYDPETGRFTAKDPLLFYGGDLNLYAYAGGDPVNRIDPTGRGDPPCDPPGEDCDGDEGGGGGGESDSRRRNPWDSPLPFSLPNGLRDIVEWVGGINNAVVYMDAAPIFNAVGAFASLLAWPVAFESARQDGARLAEQLYTDRVERDMRRLDDYFEQYERQAEIEPRSRCP